MNQPSGIGRMTMDACCQALGELLRFNQPADGVLSSFFRRHKGLGPRERAVVAETCYAVLRRKRLLERLVARMDGSVAAAGNARRLAIACLVRIQGVGVRQLSGALTEAEMTWAAQCKSTEAPAATLAEKLDFPDWLAERLAGRMDNAELAELARTLNSPAPLDLRVNPLKLPRDQALARLAADGIAGDACALAPLGIRLREKPSLARHPLFLDGSIEVQDEGSQLLGHLLAPRRGEMVVDFCAGAGGKTLLLGALMRSSGRLYAFDVSEGRLAKMKPRLARSGLSNVHPVCIAGENDARIKRLAGKADRVLVDAPCSGLGTLRRNPDLKWRQTPEAVTELAEKQARILASASRLVLTGGRLVYATCSLLSEENETIADAFLAAHPDFKRLDAPALLAASGVRGLEGGPDLRLWPHRHGTDGFYAAVFERSGPSPAAAQEH